MNFVFVDRLLDLEGDRARFVKCCTLSEDFYMQHFPGFPVLPGALVLETFVQAATLYLAASSGFRGWPLLREIGRARFRRMVTPGDRLEVEISGGSESLKAEASVDGERVASAELGFVMVRPDESEDAEPYRGALASARVFLGMLRAVEQ